MMSREGTPLERGTLRRERKGTLDGYIVDHGESVSYLGVEVPKGEGGPLVPDKQESANYFYTEEDHLLRREIATSLVMNKPLLIEGGTGIGKTSTVAAMCADLNMNYCKVSFGRDMAVEDVIGGKTITADEHGNEVVKWYDGNLLVAIRQGGIAFLDEYNMQGSKIGSRVNPIMDAILNGRKEIFLPENDNERVEVHPNFRIIAAQNPPGTEEGQEFTGRDILSAESFGRWTFHKMPLDMSKDMRNKRMAGMMGEPVDVNVPESELRYLGEGIPLRELTDIPGMTHWRREAIDIIDMLKAKSTGVSREMARDQRQKIYFNPRLEQGLLNYVSRFYRGDVNQVWKDAFEHLIVGMYKSRADRQKVREALNQAVYMPQSESKRKGLEGESPTPETTGSVESAELKEAQEVFGEDFFGFTEAEQFTGVAISEADKGTALAQWQEKVRAQGITREQLERLKQEGFMIVYRPSTMQVEGKDVPTTLLNLKKVHGSLFWSGQDWYEKGAETKKWSDTAIRAGWSIVKKEILEESRSKDWDQQEEILKRWAQEHGVREEFVTRRKPEEIVYDILLNYKLRNRRVLERDWDWSGVQSSDGGLVGVGGLVSGGLSVGSVSRGFSDSVLGVCPSL